ncbi:MAG: sugar transferase [Planctomycetota bacterium]|nr:MAG: sugar transferase [Planctomycetota bacterium]
MLQAHHRIFASTIFGLDLALLSAAALASRVLPFSSLELLPMPLLHAVGVVALFSATWVILSVRLDLYHSRRTETLIHEIQVLVEALIFTIGLQLMIQVVLLGGLEIEPTATLVFAFAGLLLPRLFIRTLLRFLRRKGRNFREVLVVGYGDSASAITELLRKNRQYGLRVFGAVPFTKESDVPQGVRELGTTEDLETILQEYTVDAVLLCPSRGATSGQIQKVIDLCDLVGVVCHFAPSYLTLSNLAPMMVHYGSLPVFAFRPGPVAPVRLAIKRALDIVLSAMAIIFGAPLLLGCAIAVKLEDGGPIFFKQVRLGRNARPFLCLKFRSMCIDAEDKKKEIEGENEQAGPVFKMKDDPRITRVGRFMRKYSFDELPQFFNVFFGQMSLVGPRPPIPSEVIEYDWWQRRRLSVRPGITCTWQVSGRNEISFEQWMEMDLDYIDRWSLTEDFRLMARTVGTMIKGSGM